MKRSIIVMGVIVALSTMTLAYTTTIVTPAAWGDVTSFHFERAFDAQPTWGGAAPVGGDTSSDDFWANWENGSKVSFIDLGTNWADWRIEQTWTKNIKWRSGAAHPYAELWWDDDIDTTNDGTTETTLNFATQPQDGSGLWLQDAAPVSPVTPQGRYLMLRQPATDPENSDVVEAAFVGYIVPEPATMGLLAMGGLGILLRRRRRA